MSDQCKHCTVRGDWDKCQSTECFHHENWAWLQLKDQRDKLQDRVQELEALQLTMSDSVDDWIDKAHDFEEERDKLQARVQKLEKKLRGYQAQNRVDKLMAPEL